ncbi:MAG: YhbY family RNA-binding protein [Thermoplasmata archaeon]
MDEERIKKLGQKLKPLVRIGKNGVTEGMVDEINRHLEDEDILKIKILRNCPVRDHEELTAVLEEKTYGHVVEHRGNTVLLVDKDELNR